MYMYTHIYTLRCRAFGGRGDDGAGGGASAVETVNLQRRKRTYAPASEWRGAHRRRARCRCPKSRVCMHGVYEYARMLCE